MRLPPLPLVVLDTETTGFVPRTHRVIEFASAEVRDGELVREFDQLFACDDVPPHVEVLTRIFTEDLQGKPAFASKRDEVLAHIPDDALIVGQNVLFDIGMLKGENVDLTERPWIDTSMLASLVFPELQSYSLGYLSQVLNLNHNPPHRALGDVRATLELLSKCWERMCLLPTEMLDDAKTIMAKSSPGYQQLFAALPAATAKTRPEWLRVRQNDDVAASSATLTIKAPKNDTVELREEPLDPTHLHALLRGALHDTTVTHWIAVKNLRTILRRLPHDLRLAIDKDMLRPLYAPSFLLDSAAADRLLAQDTLTADEATLALKLAWYTPSRRDELPMHGGEEAVWNGKLACTEASDAYAAQFRNLPGVVMLDHRELLRFLELPEHPARASMDEKIHIIIDDASMLEDTATKAFGWYCQLENLRAAAEGNKLLTQFTDILQLWIEKIRQEQDIRYLTESDIKTPDARGLREQLDEVLKQEWPQRTRDELLCVSRVLDPMNLADRITWIELKPNGSQMIQSVPERIGRHMTQTLYGKYPVSLLIPGGCAEKLPEILPDSIATASVPLAADALQMFVNALPLSLQTEPTLDAVLHAPPEGKTIILLPGKGMIEDLYVKHTQALEERGITMICQGLNGGLGRMQAEFLSAQGTVLWLLTPWMFEGVELPPESVNHLLIKTLPFDHPSHPVFSRRAARYGNAFGEYSLPRLLHRLFRVLRTFARFRTKTGDVRAMDDRLYSKSYGKDVCAYLKNFSNTAVLESATPPKTEAPKKKLRAKKPEKPTDQLSMF